MIDSILEMLSYPFMVRAIFVGVAVALASALLGVPLVLRRYSMIGDGLSHVGFGALAAAAVMNLAPLSVAIPVVTFAAVVLLGISEKVRVRADAAIAVASTGALAFGIVVISLSGGVNTDVYNYMFGSIFALTEGEAVAAAVICFASSALYVCLMGRFFSVTFDESFAKASGIKTTFYNLILAILTALTIVLGMRMMGALMITALTTIPALTSMKLAKSFRGAAAVSSVVGVSCALGGVLCSYYLGLPPGASVVLLNITVLSAASLFKIAISKNKKP